MPLTRGTYQDLLTTVAVQTVRPRRQITQPYLCTIMIRQYCTKGQTILYQIYQWLQTVLYNTLPMARPRYTILYQIPMAIDCYTILYRWLDHVVPYCIVPNTNGYRLCYTILYRWLDHVVRHTVPNTDTVPILYHTVPIATPCCTILY